MNKKYYYAKVITFSKKATKIDQIFTGDLTLCSKCQIDGEYFVNFCGLLRKHELYKLSEWWNYEAVYDNLMWSPAI